MRRGVGVQDGAVLRVAERAEQAPLVGVGVAEQRQRLVGVRGDDDVIEGAVVSRAHR